MLRFCLFLLLSLTLTTPTHSAESRIKRTVLALYQEAEDPHLWYQDIHQYLEMPLNHLGYKVVYHEMTKPLPDVHSLEDVAAVLTWFSGEDVVPNPPLFVDWLQQLHNKGTRLILIGNPGFGSEGGGNMTALLNRVYGMIDMALTGTYISQTYDVEFLKLNPNLVNFERKYPAIKPPFQQVVPIKDSVKAHVLARVGGDESTDSALLATGLNGAYADPGYFIYRLYKNEKEYREWYVNPFLFLKLALLEQEKPIPDTTTLAGKRMYYSHIDGDGWNNRSEVEGYQETGSLSAEVILKEVIEPYPDMPVTVAPIGADINVKWAGSPEARDIAKVTFKLPHVEAGSHTYSHPFYWRFFANYFPKKEEAFLDKYPHGSWKSNSVVSAIKGLFITQKSEIDDDITAADEKHAVEEAETLKNGYDIPRAFALKPFNIDLEVKGSLKEVDTLCPPGKKAKILQWSGDCQPWAGAIAKTREAGVYNINGGDTRFDSQYNSYAWVRPLSVRMGDQLQVYASGSNENTYTKLWTKKFYGFNQLPETFHNTEVPIRLKPMNLYYHMYSGQKRASLEALLQNVAYIRDQDPHSVDTSHFTAIVEGFISAKIYELGERSWRIQDRGELQTVRFDQAIFSGVDFSKAKGVIGQRHHQGSLYVYLDRSVNDPTVALKEIQLLHEEPLEELPYLIESQWQIWDLTFNGTKEMAFKAKGYGNGEMQWRFPWNGKFKVSLTNGGKAFTQEVTVKDGMLELSFDDQAFEPVVVEIRRM